MVDRVISKLRQFIHYLLHINVYFGKNVILRGVPKLVYGDKIKFGKNVRLNDNVFLHSSKGIVIGDNTTLSYGVSVITESYDTSDFTRYVERHHLGKPVNIGKNVWICANATILPGVNIGDNIVVGAGSVVTKDLLEENSLYAGNPAKFIRKMRW